MTQIALWSALGEAVVAPIFGLLMDWFSHNMLFYSLLALGIVLLFATHYLETLYENDAKAITSSSSMELKDMLLTDSSWEISWEKSFQFFKKFLLSNKSNW